MHLPPRQYAAFAFVAAAGLYLAFRPRPSELDDPPEANPAEPLPEIVLLRNHARTRIVDEVIDGRRSLLEAAALFRELDRLPPTAAVQFGRIPFPLPITTRTEEEQYCRAVAVWVWSRVVVPQSPGDGNSDERAAVAVARLVAEFEDELTRRGAIRLPDPSTLESADSLIERARAESAKSLRQRP